MCCGLANFLIKVYDSAADSPLLSVKRAPRRSEWKEKLPQREYSGHFDVMLSVLKDRKASDVPHTGFYGYNLR